MNAMFALSLAEIFRISVAHDGRAPQAHAAAALEISLRREIPVEEFKVAFLR